MSQFTLAKNERLKSRKQIQLLFAHGKSFSLPPFRVYYSIESDVENDTFKAESAEPAEKKPSPLPGSRIGVGVSTRNFKHATDRNRIKRLIRESWRLQKTELNEVLRRNQKQMNVFIIYTGKELTGFEHIKKTTAAALQKLIRIWEKPAS